MINSNEIKNSIQFIELRGNTSQHNTFSNFRNEKFNGRNIELTDRFFDKLPKKGILEFDYVSTTRPEDQNNFIPSILDENQVNTLLETIGAQLWSDFVPQDKSYDFKRQVVLLQHALSGFYIMAQDVRRIMQYFPTNIDNLRLKVVLASHRSIYDMEHFECVYEKLMAMDRKTMFLTLGYMNTLNPLNVDMEFDLQMNYPDNRLLVRTLIEMISNDPLDLIKLDDMSMKDGQSIYSMFSPANIPTSGRLGFRYITRPNKSFNELIETRQSTFHSFLFAERLRCTKKVDGR